MCCCGGFSLVFFTKDQFFFSHFLFCLELVSGLEKKHFPKKTTFFTMLL